MTFGHQVLLAVALTALGAAALRVAALTTERPLAQVVAAAPLLAATAVVETLVLGLVGLGPTAVALSAAAVATWLAVRALVPAPVTTLGARWARSARGLPLPSRLGVGLLAGLVLGTIGSLLHRPPLGVDGVVYHLADVTSWLHSGHPGAVVNLLHGFPVGNYPLTHEVLLTWAMGISRSFAPAIPLEVLMLVLLAGAGWLGLEALGVPRLPRALAVAAVALTPDMLTQLHGPNTDLPATAWLVASGALCAAAARERRLLAPAIVAAGLAAGTKTTVLPLLGILVVVTVLAHRRSWRQVRGPVLAGLSLALAAGGVWYLRNWVDHGSPLWPFVALPGGDPTPKGLSSIHYTLLSRPAATLRGRAHLYAEVIGGGVILIVAALVAPLIRRQRAVLVGAGATGVSLLLWASAPVTGITNDPRLAYYSLTTTRYLLPVVAVGALTVALGTRPTPGCGGERWRALLTLALGAAVVMDVALWHHIDSTLLPTARWLTLGAVVGLAVAALWGRLDAVGRRAGVLASLGGLAVALVLGAGALSAAASGLVERHDRLATFDAPIVRWFAAQPGFDSASHPVLMGPVVISVLSGDGLQRSVQPLPASEPCGTVTSALARGDWVILKDPAFEVLISGLPYTVQRCVAGLRPVHSVAGYSVYHE